MYRKMNDSGISTVVGLILILGLIVSVAAVIKLTYIPDVKKQLEADHMQHVIRDIQTFKAQLDLDQAAASTGVGYVATANIEMGGGAIPGIDPSVSSGTLSLDPAYGQLTITAYEYPSGLPLNLGSATAIGRLVYQSNNNHFVNQNVSYECGMITLAQPGGNVMLTPPPIMFAIDPVVYGRPIVSMNALRLNGTAQTFSSGGIGTVRTGLMPGSTAYASKNVTNVSFTIVSDYASLWYSYLSSTLATSGLEANNYQLARPDARTVILRINGTGTQNTGFYLADSSFGTSMGYNTAPPGSASPTPGPVQPSALVADFRATPASGAAPLTVEFADLSTGSPTSWQWSFGDATANMSTQSGPHTYTTAGNYTVTLTVYNSTSRSTTQKVGYVRINNTLSVTSSSITQVTMNNNGSSGMKTYTLDISITVRNNGPGQATSVLASILPPQDAGGDGPTYIVLISSPSNNPRNIANGNSATFTWRYRLDKKQNVRPITFTLSTQGSNTNLVTATPAFNS